ncbi:transposase [Elysia marginata]|uniref:Transposase n=1 Tax=Elysia marginata TaxID=1093978 RepID=A0AAV4JRG3_9GAST|nr:transposase [Elysia marginata]
MKFPSNWDTEKLAGKEWYRGFMRRNPQISIRQPEATSLARATAFNPYTVGVYFDNLECAFRKTGRPIKIHHIAQLGGSAFIRAATPSNICSGFRVSGMWPLDKTAFHVDEFLPSLVTDRPTPQTSSIPSESALVTPGPSSATTVSATTTLEPASANPGPAETTSATKGPASAGQVVVTPGPATATPEPVATSEPL